MDNIIVLRYGELFLKGKNRGFFERLLIRNIKNKLEKFDCKFRAYRGRYEVYDYKASDEAAIVSAMRSVFGLKSLSVAVKTPADFDVMSDVILKIIPNNASFKVETHRADKNFPYSSPQISAMLGEKILAANDTLSVDVHKPAVTVSVDIRENGCAYVYGGKEDCLGGMPLGSAGKGLLLLSGGIDSPVSGFMMSKRGLSLDAIHFHSYPYTSVMAKDKVVELAGIMSRYCGAMNLIVVPITELQELIHKNCSSEYMITLVRRFMMRIAERVAKLFDCGCLVTGESLGQVASQTLQSISVTNDIIKTIPVFRPLIGMDKQEIIDLALEIGTYDTSVLPYEDCCTVFLPDSPVTKPTLVRAESEESKLGDFLGAIERALEKIEIIKIKERA